MDRREAILSRLFEILQGVQSFAAVYRNRPLNPSTALRPALFLFDAHESRDEKIPEIAFRTLLTTAVKMTPEIFISLSDAPENVGPDLNGLRLEVLKAIAADDNSPPVPGSLRDLVTQSGDIRYEGCATALTMASGVEGEMAVSITFAYPLLNVDLSA
jgi:hypothetical protein